jgi:hypothetical protein
MNESARRLVLRANAVWLGGTAFASLLLDIAGIFFGRGATAQIVAAAPHAGAAFIENHGLAVILAVLLWRAEPRRELHVAGAAAMALLGTCNLVFWSIYAAMGAQAMGYVTTSIHWILALAQLAAAFAPPSGR